MTPQELASAPDDIVIAWNVIRIREGLGLTQAQVAEMGNVIVSYVGKIESAKVGFGTRAQQKWSKILGVDRTEFLRRPDAGLAVIGAVVEKGIVVRHGPEYELEYVPSLAGSVFCLKVSTDALYPYLRKDSYLYVVTMSVSSIRNDDLVIYAEEGESAGIKEVEWLGDGRIVLKGLGRGSTITKMASDLATVQKVIFIRM